MACYLGASAIRTYQRRPAVDSVMELVKGPKSFSLFMEDAMHNVIYAVIMLPSPLSSISILAMMSPVIFAFFQSASYMDSVFKVSCLLGVHGLRASNRHLAAVVFVIPAFVPGRTVAHASISFNLTPPSAAAWLSVEAHVSRADAQSGGLEGKGPVGTMPLLSLLSLVVAATLLGCSPPPPPPNQAGITSPPALVHAAACAVRRPSPGERCTSQTLHDVASSRTQHCCCCCCSSPFPSLSRLGVRDGR